MIQRGTVRHAHVVGWGKYVPSKVVTNADIARTVDTSDDWITTRTGIRERRIAAWPEETTATMAIAAAREALTTARITPLEVDLIIVATVTPEYVFPSTACLVQAALGAANAGAFDLSAGCSGFLYALAMGVQGIAASAHDCVLVIGADTLSRIVNWHDRDTCVLFGDGAGAIVLRGSHRTGGVLSTLVQADGTGGECLMALAGRGQQSITPDKSIPGSYCVQMNGREVFRFATRVMDKATRHVVARAGLSMKDIRLVVPHQANLRIIQSAARSLNLPIDKFFVNLDKYGNTSAASIPIALCEAVAAGHLQPNDYLVMIGFGAGLTWAAAVVRWEMPCSAPPSGRRFWRMPHRALAGVWSHARQIPRQIAAMFSIPTTLRGRIVH